MATNTSVALRQDETFGRHGWVSRSTQVCSAHCICAAPDIGIKQAACRRESGDGEMADGLARIFGRVGVVTTARGPAARMLWPLWTPLLGRVARC